MNAKRKAALRRVVFTALELRLDALDAVVANRCAYTIRYSMYCAEKLEDAITNYHDEQTKDA